NGRVFPARSSHMKCSFSSDGKPRQFEQVHRTEINIVTRQVKLRIISREVMGEASSEMRAVVNQGNTMQFNRIGRDLHLAAKHAEWLAIRCQPGDLNAAASARIGRGAGNIQV